MKVLAQKFWREPAFCIGVLGTIAMIVLKVVAQSGSIQGVDDVAQVLLPLVAGLLTRRVVSPAFSGEPNTMNEPESKPKKKAA